MNVPVVFGIRTYDFWTKVPKAITKSKSSVLKSRPSCLFAVMWAADGWVVVSNWIRPTSRWLVIGLSNLLQNCATTLNILQFFRKNSKSLRHKIKYCLFAKKVLKRTTTIVHNASQGLLVIETYYQQSQSLSAMEWKLLLGVFTSAVSSDPQHYNRSG